MAYEECDDNIECQEHVEPSVELDGTLSTISSQEIDRLNSLLNSEDDINIDVSGIDTSTISIPEISIGIPTEDGNMVFGSIGDDPVANALPSLFKAISSSTDNKDEIVPLYVELAEATKTLLDEEYNKTRITGNDYSQALVALLGSAMQVATQYTSAQSELKSKSMMEAIDTIHRHEVANAELKLKAESEIVSAEATISKIKAEIAAIEIQSKQDQILNYSKAAELLQNRILAYATTEDSLITGKMDRIVKTSELCSLEISREVSKAQACLYKEQQRGYKYQRRLDAYKITLDAWVAWGASMADTPPTPQMFSNVGYDGGDGIIKIDDVFYKIMDKDFDLEDVDIR